MRARAGPNGADHGVARFDPYSQRKTIAMGADISDRAESGPQGPFGVVLMRLRTAEDRHQPSTRNRRHCPGQRFDLSYYTLPRHH